MAAKSSSSSCVVQTHRRGEDAQDAQLCDLQLRLFTAFMTCRLFPMRHLTADNGALRPVVLHGELVQYLQVKAKGKTDYLKFQGRNLAVYGNQQTT